MKAIRCGPPFGKGMGLVTTTQRTIDRRISQSPGWGPLAAGGDVCTIPEVPEHLGRSHRSPKGLVLRSK